MLNCFVLLFKSCLDGPEKGLKVDWIFKKRNKEQSGSIFSIKYGIVEMTHSSGLHSSVGSDLIPAT